jgi:hypothetical protein
MANNGHQILRCRLPVGRVSVERDLPLGRWMETLSFLQDIGRQFFSNPARIMVHPEDLLWCLHNLRVVLTGLPQVVSWRKWTHPVVNWSLEVLAEPVTDASTHPCFHHAFLDNPLFKLGELLFPQYQHLLVPAIDGQGYVTDEPLHLSGPARHLVGDPTMQNVDPEQTVVPWLADLRAPPLVPEPWEAGRKRKGALRGRPGTSSRS